MSDMSYPTEEELDRIRTWDSAEGFGPLMEYIKSLWAYADWGWSERGHTFHISTGGWSGNEQLIAAMMENDVFWWLCWVWSRQGGHYGFEVPERMWEPADKREEQCAPGLD